MSKFKILRIIGQYISPSTLKRVLDFLRYYIGGILRRIDNHHIFLSGGGIAFSLLLSLIPFILLAFAILGNIIDPLIIEQQITKAIDTIIPYPEYADYTKNAILNRIPGVIEYKTAAAYLGGLGLLFTSTWLFSSMRTVLNNVYGTASDKGALHGLVRDFGMVLLIIVFILLSTFVIPLFKFLLNSAKHIEILNFLRVSDFIDLLLSALSLLIILLMFFVFYKIIPYAKLGKKVPLVSALWATILWEIARSIFGYYVSHFLSANKIYGAFVLIAVILFWLFYSSCLFIIGAEIGQLYRERRIILRNRNSQ